MHNKAWHGYIWLVNITPNISFYLFEKTSEKVLSFVVAKRITSEEHFLLSLSTNH
jgi:hypothetical protein